MYINWFGLKPVSVLSLVCIRAVKGQVGSLAGSDLGGVYYMFQSFIYISILFIAHPTFLHPPSSTHSPPLPLPTSSHSLCPSHSLHLPPHTLPLPPPPSTPPPPTISAHLSLHRHTALHKFVVCPLTSEPGRRHYASSQKVYLCCHVTCTASC